MKKVTFAEFLQLERRIDMEGNIHIVNFCLDSKIFAQLRYEENDVMLSQICVFINYTEHDKGYGTCMVEYLLSQIAKDKPVKMGDNIIDSTGKMNHIFQKIYKKYFTERLYTEKGICGKEDVRLVYYTRMHILQD